VLYQRAPAEEIARRMELSPERVAALLRSARNKLHEARARRPVPYIDRTVYTGWNGLCISAYLQAASALDLHDARRFALRSLDRVLAEGWLEKGKLRHAITYSGAGDSAGVAGVLDDYAFTTLACLDAYEATADMTYFNFANRLGDMMVERFYDRQDGGFFDIENAPEALGALSARRKPFQDAPTPAGNSSAAIALLRLYHYTGEERWRDMARKTLEVFAGFASQFGIFAATYAIAVTWYSQPHTQVAVIDRDGLAGRLYQAALSPFAIGKSVLRLADNETVPQNLPPALAETVPNLSAADHPGSLAVVCSGSVCLPPVNDPETLASLVRQSLGASQPRDLSAAD
jgi:hypothetical protein